MPSDKPSHSTHPQPGEESPVGVPSNRLSVGFALLLSVVLTVCLLVMLVRDPSQRAALLKEMNRQRYLHDQEMALAFNEANGLRESILNLQQILRETQQDLLMTQHFLGEARKANDELLAAGRTLPAAGQQAPKAETAPAQPVAVVPPAPPETEAERQARIYRELEGIQNALRANAVEYVNLSQALAQTKRSLALARGSAPADALGVARSTATNLAEWPPDEFLSQEELATREAASRDAEITLTAAPSDPAAVTREMARLNRTLVQAQRRLGDGQKHLVALQEELRAVLAR